MWMVSSGCGHWPDQSETVTVIIINPNYVHYIAVE